VGDVDTGFQETALRDTQPMPSGRALDRRILALALPVLATLAADPLYALTDTAILGHLGTAALGGAAIANVVLELGYAIFIFLMFGTTAAVSRLIGSGRPDEAAEHALQALWLALGLGIAVAVVLVPLGAPLLSLFGAHGDVTHAAHVYFTISLAGLPAFLIVMAAVGYLRGTQDTRTPLYVAMGTVVLNLVLEVVAIYVLGFGVGASALGTVIAKWVGALVLGGLVVRDVRRRGLPLRPHLAGIGRVGSAGWPLFVRTAALRLSFAASTAVAGRMSQDDLAGFAIAFQIWITLAYVVDGLEVAGQALVGHSLGAGDPHGSRRVGRRILLWALGLGLVTGVVLWAVRTPLVAIFTSDPAVRAIAVTSLAWVAAMQPINAVTFSLDGILVGAGDLWFLAIAMIGAAVCFVPMAILVATGADTIGWLWAALTAFMALRLLTLLARFAGHRWERIGATV
jgi:putative MATE family efflux protein